MRVPRIHLELPLEPGATVTLDERAATHVTRVLRLRPGAELLLFNGEGGEYRAQLLEARRGRVLAEVGEYCESGAGPGLRLVLAQGISRGNRMDLTLQKATELGVTRIFPLWTERSQTRLDGERLDKRLRHWRGVILHACEQSGRTRIPQLEPPRGLRDWLQGYSTRGPWLILDPTGALTLPELPAPQDEVTLLSGPEGGLSAAEREAARLQGLSTLRLGPRVLRTETAALAGLAAIQALWGDFR